MERIDSQALKSILVSKRANIFYLEHCRVLVNGGRVEYVTDDGRRSHYWNIPIANTTTILLGTGTSITQAAARELARAGILIGVCGSNGTPLFSATDHELPICWFTPQSEYRPTEYVQAWLGFWFDEGKRLEAAKLLQKSRLDYVRRHWTSSRFGRPFLADASQLYPVLDNAWDQMASASDGMELLLEEARLTKVLYKIAAQTAGYGAFVRQRAEQASDRANRFLDHGNYLAYGLGATAAWTLGLPHAFALMHGKTRRGALVFDVADLIKDALIMPLAFSSAIEGDTDQQFRQHCVEKLVEAEALDFIIDTLKVIAFSMEKQG
ncbi:type I-F CRISPR-associated endonuclease Cas1f [Mailhella sp.]|uniref:type I-F CRISPR-associated endonuclease Cas1f n=1 Tax=Mailhella sp. TaxID=1981029 RepID=UPI0040628938